MKHLRLFSFLLLIIMTGMAVPLKAQIVLKGRITTGKNEPVAFAPVILQQLPDTTRYTEGVITDMAGNYRFGKHRAGRYLLSVRAIGYKTLYDTVLLRKPSAGAAEVVRDYFLDEEAAQLDEVVVTANNTASYFDRTVYTITSEDRKAAVSGLDLTDKIAEIQIDRVADKISTSEGEVTILINGVTASEKELKTIHPDEVRKMEFYNLPPIRFGLANNNKVLNIITKKRADGIYGGVNLAHYVTTASFGDYLFLRYNRGSHQWAFSAQVNHGSAYGQYALTDMEYAIEGTDFRQVQESKAKSKSWGSNLSVQYTNQIAEKYVFQASFTPNYRNSSKKEDLQLVFMQDNDESNRYGMSDQKSQAFFPAVNLYFWRQFRNRNELMLTLGSGYENLSSDTYRNQYELLPEDTPVFEDFLDTKGDSYWINGQALYTKTFDKLVISVGDYLYYDAAKYRMNNSSGHSDENNSMLKNYFAGEVTGKIGQGFSYRFSLGVTGSHIKTSENAVWQWIFTPRVDIGYRISPSFVVKAGFTQANMSPSLGQLNEVGSFLSQNIVAHGNPDLIGSRANQTIVRVNYHNKWLNVDLSYDYLYMKNPINFYYQYEQPYIAYAPVNDSSQGKHTVYCSVKISPFKNNLLSLKLDGGFIHTKINSKILGPFEQTRLPLSYSLNFNHKNFSVFYSGSLPSDAMSLPWLYRRKLTSTIGVQYKYKDWAFSAFCSNFLINPKTNSYTLENSVLHENVIGYNKSSWNSVLLKVDFHFGKGKQYQEPDRKTIKEGL